MVLFIILYKVDLTFKSVDKILQRDHLNETVSERCVSCLLCVVLCITYAVQGGSTFCVCG